MADIYMVSHLGPEAISAVGTARALAMVISIAMLVVTTGTFAMVAQAVGAGDARRASIAVKQSLTLVSLLSVALSLFGIATARFGLESLSLSPEVVDLGVPYLRIYCLSMLVSPLGWTITTALHGAGDTRTPLLLNIVASLVKIAISYLLIYGHWGLPELGVVGAAWGMVASRLCAAAAGLAILYSGRFALKLLPGTSYRPDFDLVRRIARVGLPSALQGLFRNSSGVVFIKLVALTTASTTAVAAFSIGNQMERMLRHSSLAFGTAATTLTGQSLGAGDAQRAEQSGWTTSLIGVLSLTVLGLPVIFFAHPIMASFTDAPEVIQIGVYYLIAVAIAEPFMCLAVSTGGGLRGAGDTRPGFHYTVISQWLVRLPVAYLLAFPLGFDTNGLWASLVIYCVVQGFLTMFKFGKGEWKTRKL